MATIQPGNFPNIPHQPGKNRETRKQEQGPGFPGQDGLDIGRIELPHGLPNIGPLQLPPGVPTPGPAQLPGPAPIEVPYKFPLEVETPVETSTRVHIPHEFEGAFMTGPGVASGIASIGAPGQTGGLSEFTFTNGVRSTQLVGLSGNVWADANPFKS